MSKDIVNAIGIDIGGTNTKICLVNNQGEISNLVKIETYVDPAEPRKFLDEISNTALTLLNEHQGKVVGVGISCLGLQNEDGSGPRNSANVPGLNDVNIRNPLQESIGLPVTITNDLMANTLAEYHFGCGRGSQRFMSVALGTGLGAAAIIDGVPVKLWGGTSGDTGRIALEPDSEIICGGKVHGSAEALCGVAAIERYAQSLYKRQHVTAREVIIACKDGNDPIAEEIIKTVGRHVGHLIAILSVVFAPERVALTGGTTNAGPVLLKSCRDRFDEIAGGFFNILSAATPPVHPGIEILFGELKGEAGVVGGAVEILKPYM